MLTRRKQPRGKASEPLEVVGTFHRPGLESERLILISITYDCSISSLDIGGRETLRTILDTEVMERGNNLSGGLAQSVALARVFVRPQAHIVILDESIGQMDNHKKKTVIFPHLFEFVEKHNITLIMISQDMVNGCLPLKVVTNISQHDIMDLDYIYVMERGKIVHHGSHEDLLAQNAYSYLQLNEYC